MIPERAEVVVIGAGLGGLAAGAALARAGVSVVLVERHAQAGGYASAFSRGEHDFEVSLHLMDAIGAGEPGRALLDSLGVALDFAMPRVLRRELGPGHELMIARGRRELEESIAALFPHERSGFRALFELGEAAQRASLELDDGEPREVEETIDRLGPLARCTAQEIVRAKIADAKLIAVLERFAAGWLGRPLAALRAPEFLVPWFSYHALSGGYPHGGSAALSNALVAVIERAGGVVVLGMGAKRIVVERRRATAVELDDGRRIECRAIVSNVCPAITFGALIDRGELPSAERTRLERLEPSVSCFKVWIGTRRPIESAAYETDLMAMTSFMATADREDRWDPARCRLSVVVPSALGTGISARVLSASTLVRPQELDPEQSREELGALVVARLSRELFAGLESNIDHLEVATPATFEKFTGNPSGAIYGGCIRGGALDGWRPSAKTPIDRLYLAGAWTQPGAGFTTVLRSGKRAARAVLRGMRSHASV